MWTIHEAIALIRLIEPDLREVGFFTGLTGSCLHRGASNKDTDIIIMPLSTTDVDYSKVKTVLERNGLKPMAGKSNPYRVHKTDHKVVELWEFNGKRVDIFLMS